MTTMMPDAPHQEEDDRLRASIVDWLARAESVLAYTREHFGPREEGELLSEIGFYRSMLARIDTSESTPIAEVRPPALVLTTTIQMLSDSLERAFEDEAVSRERGHEEAAAAAATRAQRIQSLVRYVSGLREST